jgi:hypothetical protein
MDGIDLSSPEERLIGDYFRARAERMYRNAAFARVRESVGADAKNNAKPRFGATDMA